MPDTLFTLPTTLLDIEDNNDVGQAGRAQSSISGALKRVKEALLELQDAAASEFVDVSEAGEALQTAEEVLIDQHQQISDKIDVFCGWSERNANPTNKAMTGWSGGP